MTTETLLEAQTVALLRRLAREEETRTRRAQDEASEQSREIVRRARSEARARVHQAVADTRREIELAIARRRAAIDTRERRARQTMLRKLLEDAWRRLPAALEQRWGDRDARATWCRAACAQATRSLLHAEHLCIEVDPRWREEMRPIVTAALGDTVELVPVADLGAGLRIRSGRGCVDATVAGLVAARERIAADLLAECEQRLAPACVEAAS